MCNVAVDFAKHGEAYADLDSMSDVAKLIKEEGYPDFMEKFGLKSRVSQGVIG